MTWDDMLARMRASDLEPEEENYLENYGHILSVERPAFRERRFRCTHGAARIKETRIEACFFASPPEAEDFLTLIEEEVGWRHHHNVVFRIDGPLSEPFRGFLEKELGGAGS